jgi:hypothetical protein
MITLLLITIFYVEIIFEMNKLKLKKETIARISQTAQQVKILDSVKQVKIAD